MSINTHYSKEFFEDLIKTNFDFAESEFAMHLTNVSVSGGKDPRDAALVARYRGANFRFDVGWNEFELSLAVLVKFEDLNLSRQERYVYLEPFIEYLSNDGDPVIVPYVSENMSIRQTKATLEKRRSVFENGLEPVVDQVAQKMRRNFDKLTDASTDQVRGYHVWMSSKR